jgi:predicted RNase H-like HicB family nuclease
MKKLIYPGVFHKEGKQYWVEFPDLPGCQSFADTLEEIHEYAKEVLTGYCVSVLENKEKLNPPSDILKIKTEKNCFVSLVEADLIKKSQSVKKTLTIPSWLNTAAEEKHINFSGALQEALMQKLELTL